ncbi:response regulator transcription factor [Pedobacter sp. L105]|uniref:response regulator transcription factor n=1 Tax=Pedobacter sp. L105 TaxID=1641871 RepID=UPI00131BCF4A|nr:response regulator [Pedobacter sp. L105]
MAKQIYILEDDEDIRFIVSYILNEIGYEVTEAETLKQFHQQLETGLPDLMLLDIMLPDGNGLELCEELKKDPAISHIPIIMMSAHAAQEFVQEKACAQDFISKPFDLDNLTNMIRKYLPN